MLEAVYLWAGAHPVWSLALYSGATAGLLYLGRRLWPSDERSTR